MFLKTFFLTITLICGTWMLLSMPVQAQFNPLKEACKEAPNSPVCKEASAQGSSNPITGQGGLVASIARIITIIVGIASVIMLIYGGYLFVTAGGAIPGQRAGDSPNRAAKARMTIIGAIIGLVVAALSWLIIGYVVKVVLQT